MKASRIHGQWAQRWAAIAIVGLSGAAPAFATTYNVIYNFGAHAKDGTSPSSTPYRDANNNLFVTTQSGGANGAGAVVEISPPAKPGGNWTEKVIHNFGAKGAPANPSTGLIADANGNFYGTTPYGGASSNGAVYMMSPPTEAGQSWTVKVLHSFVSNLDGANPVAGLTLDANGNLYGTTTAGAFGFGTVFELSPPAAPGKSWTEKVLHRFSGSAGDGSYPEGGLILGPGGGVYGTTQRGGSYGVGTVFKLTPPTTDTGQWIVSILHNFSGGGCYGCSSDGWLPFAGLTRDTKGTFLGTTAFGGSNNHGTVFQMVPPTSPGGSWTEAQLYGLTAAQVPSGSVLLGPKGIVYGTASQGLTSAGGDVFELVPTTTSGGTTWSFSELHVFGNGSDGKYPGAGLVRDAQGHLYGTTAQGGAYGFGVVFEITP